MTKLIETEFQTRIFDHNTFALALHCDRLSDAYNVLTHWHEEIEILYFIDGECKAFCNQETIYCRPGDVLLLNSFCYHGLERITPFCSYHCFFFGTDIVDREIVSVNNFHEYFLTGDPEVKHLLERVIYESEHRSEYYEYIQKAQMNLVLVHLAQSHQKHPSETNLHLKNRHADRMRQALFYINENLTSPITLENLCEITNLSSSRFSNLFKAYYGKSLVDCINIARCQYATSLYQTGKYSVAECAELSGFNNLSYFARKYREIYGTTLSKTVIKDKTSKRTE